MPARDSHETAVESEQNHHPTDQDTCPECEGQVTTTANETVCSDCGLVLEDEPIDHGPEWYAGSDDEDNPSRTGAPLTETRHDRGLSSTIGRKRDANGNSIPSRKRRRLARMRREHSRAQWGSKAERNLGHGCSQIAVIISGLELNESVREQASSLFRTAQSQDLLPGRSIESIAAGSVYAACRCSNAVRTVEEIAEVARCDAEAVQHGYNVLNVELGLPTPPPAPASFIPKLASECDVSNGVRQRATELASRAEDRGLADGRQPSGFAAACLYLAAQERDRSITQTALADAANTTPVTVRTGYRDLEEQVVADGG